MNKKTLKFKTDFDWFRIAISIAIILFFLYQSRIWKWQTLEDSRLYVLLGLVLLFYIFIQYTFTAYYLYEDALVVRYYFRPFNNKYVFPVKDIQSILYNDIAVPRVFSFITITCRNKKRKKYNLTIGDKAKIDTLLSILEEMGVKIEAKSIR